MHGNSLLRYARVEKCYRAEVATRKYDNLVLWYTARADKCHRAEVATRNYDSLVLSHKTESKDRFSCYDIKGPAELYRNAASSSQCPSWLTSFDGCRRPLNLINKRFQWGERPKKAEKHKQLSRLPCGCGGYCCRYHESVLQESGMPRKGYVPKYSQVQRDVRGGILYRMSLIPNKGNMCQSSHAIRLMLYAADGEQGRNVMLITKTSAVPVRRHKFLLGWQSYGPCLNSSKKHNVKKQEFLQLIAMKIMCNLLV